MSLNLSKFQYIPFSVCSGLEIASTKAAQHRLGRGVWTNVRFGDMRRALAGKKKKTLSKN